MSRYDDAHSDILRLTKERRYDEAVIKCEEHIRTWPPEFQHEAFHNLAYVQSASGDLRAAVATMAKAIELAPTCLGHRHARAKWALALQEYSSAILDATALLEIELAEETTVYLNEASVLRAYALIKIGKPAEALRDLANVNNEGPFRVCHSFWTKADLTSLAEKTAKVK